MSENNRSKQSSKRSSKRRSRKRSSDWKSDNRSDATPRREPVDDLSSSRIRELRKRDNNRRVKKIKVRWDGADTTLCISNHYYIAEGDTIPRYYICVDYQRRGSEYFIEMLNGERIEICEGRYIRWAGYHCWFIDQDGFESFINAFKSSNLAYTTKHAKLTTNDHGYLPETIYRDDKCGLSIVKIDCGDYHYVWDIPEYSGKPSECTPIENNIARFEKFIMETHLDDSKSVVALDEFEKITKCASALDEFEKFTYVAKMVNDKLIASGLRIKHGYSDKSELLKSTGDVSVGEHVRSQFKGQWSGWDLNIGDMGTVIGFPDNAKSQVTVKFGTMAMDMDIQHIRKLTTFPSTGLKALIRRHERAESAERRRMPPTVL